MDIHAKKIDLINWLTTLNDINMINKLLQLRQDSKLDWWDEISDAEKDSIDKGINDADAGRLNEQADVKKLYEKWL
jgi:hypothetical protein